MKTKLIGIIICMLSVGSVLPIAGQVTKNITIKNTDEINPSLNENTWMKTFGDIDRDLAYDGQQTSDGGYIMVGETESYGSAYNLWLLKTDPNGNEEWNVTFAGNMYVSGLCVQQTFDGGYITAGRKNNQYHRIIKTDEYGNIVWIYLIDKPIFSICQSEDGGFMAVGCAKSSETIIDIALLKIDQDGNKIWNKTIENSGSDRAFSIQQTFDKGYIIIGEESILKVDENGAKEWVIKLDSDIHGWDILQRNDGGYTAIGAKVDWPYIGWLMRIDGDGKIISWKNYSGLFTSYFLRSIYQTKDDGYILTGRVLTLIPGIFQPYSWKSDKLWLAKTDEYGNIQWEKRFGKPEGGDEGSAVQQTTDGGYIIIGGTNSYGAGGVDVWLIKTDSNGNVARNRERNPMKYRLFELFPNLFPILRHLLRL